MATGPQILSFPLDLGMRNTSEQQPQPFGEGAALVESRNTRVGRIDGVPTKAPAATSFGSVAGDEERIGLVPSGFGSTLILAKKAAEVMSPAGLSPLSSTTGSGNQNSYCHYFPESDSAIPGAQGMVAATPSVVIDSSGNRWFLQFRRTSAASSAAWKLTVSVVSADGALLVPPRIIATSASSVYSNPWCWLTAHGSTVVAWYQSIGDILAATITLNAAARSVTAGTPAVVITPNSIGDALASAVAVHSDGHSTYAWFVSRGIGGVNPNNRLLLTRFTIGTWATSTIDRAHGTFVGTVDVRHINISGTNYVATAAISPLHGGGDGVARAELINGTTMTSAWGPQGVSTGRDGKVAVSYFVHPGHGSFVVVAADYSRVSGGSAIASPSDVTVRPIELWSGAVMSPVVLPWKRLGSRGGWDRKDGSNTLITPLFGMHNTFYGTTAVTDPAFEIYRMADIETVSMIARFGVDTAHVPVSWPLGQIEQDAVGRVHATYTESDIARTADSTANTGRCVVMSASEAPGVVVDADGLGMMTGGPAYWDGTELAEHCSTLRPAVLIEANTGTQVWPVGNYRISAIIQWEDGTGQLRRSMPSAIVTHAAAGGQSPKFHVTLPTSMRSGIKQGGVQVILYSSLAGATSLFKVSSSPSAVTTYFAEFGSVVEPSIVIGSATPAIPTDGTASFPVPAQCPPSAKARAIVGDRMWILDARNVLWYSKPKEPGVAFEFSSEQVVSVPAAAGDARSLQELRGSLVVLAERGAWVVTGQGPDAALGGAPFNPPEQVSDIPCTARLSAVRTPAGIFFQSGSRFATFGGDLGTRKLADCDTYPGIKYSAVCLRDTDEVVWFFDDDTSAFGSAKRHVVFNYRLQRFTCWTYEVVSGARSVVVDPLTSLVQTLNWAYPWSLYVMDPDSIGDAPMIFRTGAVRLGGSEEADCALQHVLVSGKRLADHSAQVRLYQDYGQAAARNESFSVADLANASSDADENDSDRYTICVEPKASNSMRAVEIELTLTGDGDCVRPYGVTLVYSQKSGTKSDAVFQPAKR